MLNSSQNFLPSCYLLPKPLICIPQISLLLFSKPNEWLRETFCLVKRFFYILHLTQLHMAFFWLTSSCNIMFKDYKANLSRCDVRFYIVVHSFQVCPSRQITSNACSWKNKFCLHHSSRKKSDSPDEQMHLYYPSHLSQHGTVRHQIAYRISSAIWESQKIVWNQQTYTENLQRNIYISVFELHMSVKIKHFFNVKSK